jgi:hypothetical protein
MRMQDEEKGQKHQPSKSLDPDFCARRSLAKKTGDEENRKERL